MARKNRNLAGFSDVANANIKKDIDVNENVNNNVNADDNNDVHVYKNVDANNEDNNNINVNDDANIVINADNNAIVNDDDNVNASPQLDYLDQLIEGNAKKKAENETVLTGIYLQKDLSQLLDRLAKKGGRGAKSRIVNEALRSVFMDKGLL